MLHFGAMIPAHDPPALTALREQRYIAVIRAATPEAALGAARAVAAGGIRLIEVTYSVPDAPSVMRALAGRDDLIVGAGTVLTDDQCREALDAGAKFIIAPNLSAEIGRMALSAGAMFCPGAYTTGEIIAAHTAGAHLIKVYPVGVAGGPAYIKVIRDPLPDIPMLAAGGTNLDNVVPFLQAGCVGCGLGAALADPQLALRGEFAEITRRAQAFVARLDAARTAGEIGAPA